MMTLAAHPLSDMVGQQQCCDHPTVFGTLSDGVALNARFQSKQGNWLCCPTPMVEKLSSSTQGQSRSQ